MPPLGRQEACPAEPCPAEPGTADSPGDSRVRRAVALSGGPDSLCAAALMPPGLALIVDHGLRPESAKEAEVAAKMAQDLGHEARVLTWQDSKTAAKTQAAYRAGRYALLARACAQEAVTELWTGHQSDDQIETLLLRLSMASGLRGLSGMAARTWLGNTRLVRPLLTSPRTGIARWLSAHGLRALADPSNEDPRYLRVKWRAYARQNPQISAKLQDLSLTLGALRNQAIAHIPTGICTVPSQGILHLCAAKLHSCDRSGLREVLAACLRWVGGRSFAPLEGAIDFILHPPRRNAAYAVGGVCLRWDNAQGRLILRPEARGKTLAQGVAARQRETVGELWLPANQAKNGGLILGSTPKFDHEFATKCTSSPL